MIVENGPICADDPLRLRLKKMAKWTLSRPPMLAGGHRAIRLMERLVPNSRALRRSYWGMCGLHIYLGVREGLAATERPSDDRPVQVAARA